MMEMTATSAVARFFKSQNILSMLTFMGLSNYMWPPPGIVNNGDIFDFIVIGGGSAGCVIASRLVELNASVLLIEAGGQPPFESLLPGLFPLLLKTPMDWNFTSEYDEHGKNYHTGGVLEMQQGKLLGGSGQVNYMIHAKGLPKNYDQWAEITKDKSWEYKNLDKLFKKSEKVVDAKILKSPDVVFHGTKGKLKIKKYHSKTNEHYFRSYQELGQKTVLDINPNNTLGHSNAYFNIYSKLRQSTASAYLKPVKNNPKLFVMYNSLATKIVLNSNKEAVGVEILTEAGSTITVKASKEVIVSAGAIKTPQLLMLSGIGPKSHLKMKNINVVADLPVGQNFQDPPVAILVYKMKKTKPILGLSPFDFPVKVMHGNVALNDNQLHPDYHILTGVIDCPYFFVQACKMIFNFSYEICDYIGNIVKERKIHFVTHSLSYPSSRGEVVLDNTDPKQNPIVNPGYYSNDTDLVNHAKYVLHYTRVGKTKHFKKVGGELVDAQIDECKILNKESAEYWKCVIKATFSSLHMYHGTCAIGSVVNSKLEVIGVKKLRVADSSVIPASVGAPIHSTTVMVAEKLVELLEKTHKLKM